MTAKQKITATSAAALVAIGAPAYLQHEKAKRLHAELEALRPPLGATAAPATAAPPKIRRLQSEVARLSQEKRQAPSPAGLVEKTRLELLARRGSERVLDLMDEPTLDGSGRRERLDTLKGLNQAALESVGDPEIETRIGQYELAYRMQESLKAELAARDVERERKQLEDPEALKKADSHWPVSPVKATAGSAGPLGTAGSSFGFLPVGDEFRPTTANGKVLWDHGQATGAPDTEAAGDRPTAWAPKRPKSGEQWLQLGYQEAVELKEINIHETYSPGAVSRVAAIMSDGTEKTLWQGMAPPAGNELIESSVPVPPGTISREIKIYVDTSRVESWPEIDAVELVGTDGSTQWANESSASTSSSENYTRQASRRTTPALRK